MLGLLLAWGLGGSIWLLTIRKYRLVQTPRFAMDLLGFPVEFSQALFGRNGVPYALLLPNMLIFGLFTFTPMILNFYVSFTDGSSIILFDRPFVGLEKYSEIFSCESYLIPKTCANAGYNFFTSLYNTLWFVLIQVPIMCVVALITALVVNRNIRGRGLWRAMFFYPVMLSPVVIANIWNWVLNRKGVLNSSLEGLQGGLNALAGINGINMVMTVVFAVILLVVTERSLRSTRDPSLAWTGFLSVLFVAIFTWSNPASALGFESSFLLGLVLAAGIFWMVSKGGKQAQITLLVVAGITALLLLSIQFSTVFDFGRYRPINWLVTPNTGWPFFWLVFVFCWAHMGFYMLILLAGLQAIPSDLYEAAKMDATKPVRAFHRITLPLIMPTLTVVIVLSLIRSFQVFDEVYLLTGGGPGQETYMIVQNIYEVGFSDAQPDYGQAAAGSVLMAFIIAFFTFFQLWLTRRQSEL